MSTRTVEEAIRILASDRALLARFLEAPERVGAELGITPEAARAIAAADRETLRNLGVVSSLTILVERWFGESSATGPATAAYVVDESSPLPDPDVPRQIVFAGGSSHVPDLLTRPEIDPADQVARIREALAVLAARLVAAAPEVLIVTADNHFQHFQSGGFVVGTGPEHSGSMAFFGRPDLSLTLAGAPALAGRIAAAARTAGLEVEESARIDLDHGMIVPLKHLLPASVRGIVPILTQPARTFSPYGSRALGQVLQVVIAEGVERVGLLATGGLSHWLDPGKFGYVDVAFDRYVLDVIVAGRANQLADLEPYPLLEHGQYELPNWLIMLGAVGLGVRGEVLAYEPMPGSGTGWVVVEMQLPRAVAAGG